MKLTIMTYNIQHGVDHLLRLNQPGLTDTHLIHLDRFAKAIAPFHPDILSLNEMRNASPEPGFSAQAQILAEALQMPYFYFAEALPAGHHGPYGNALLSRFPFASIEKVMIPDPDSFRPGGHYETRCLIRAQVDTGHGMITVMNTHFGLEGEEAENAVKTALSLTDPEKPTLLMGDFNLTPDSPILSPLLAVYQDSAALLPPDTRTYPSHAPEIKIDYILGCGPLVFTKAQVPDLVVSDHLPYLAEIEVFE